MRLAILADIHGNHDALSRAIDQLLSENIKKLIILGDIVGYYYDPEKVMSLLSQFDYTFIKGNHELFLEKAMNDRWALDDTTGRYGNGVRHALEKLDKDQISFLTKSEEKFIIDTDGIRCLFVHATPWDLHTHIYADSPKETMDKFAGYDFDFIFLGHAHYQFKIDLESKMIINPGSVGQNREQGGVAQWLYFDTVKKSYTFNSIPYDVSNLKNKVKIVNPENKYLIDILERKK